MNTDPFEQRASHQPWRQVPVAWRQEILAAARAAERPRSVPAVSRWEQLADLLWPSPKVWAGLAAAWIAMIGLNVVLSSSTTSQFPAAAGGVQLAHNRQQQQRLMLELLNPDNDPAAPSPDGKPAPRSDRRLVQRYG
jgi:hypothetical protein